MNRAIDLSIVLATHNRRDVVLGTVERLRDLGLCGVGQRGTPSLRTQVIIVDNASRDGTADALQRFGDVTVIPLDRNRGSCAKAHGIRDARAPYLLLLDDDAWPRTGCVERMLTAFESNPQLAAAGFTVHLPDGRQECSALPGVFVGCGVGLRSAALQQVGGLDVSFFMAAEEYDLTFRLLRAAWQVEIFADLEVDHLKTPAARRQERLAHLDISNNLRIVARYLPDYAADIYRREWTLRYRWIAERNGCMQGYLLGLADGLAHMRHERWAYRAWRLTDAQFERVFCWSSIERRMQDLRGAGVRRILLAGFGKNAYAFYRGAARAGVGVAAVADDFFGTPPRAWHGIPLLPVEQALRTRFDACVISDTSYVHAARRLRDISACTDRPVHCWFEPPALTTNFAAVLPSLNFSAWPSPEATATVPPA